MRCAVGLLLILAGCTDRTDEEIRAQVTLAINHEGAPQKAALDKLAAHGRRAIPTIESAMHTASPAGKKTLIVALRQIGDPESVPLLRHVTLHDPAADVRREAEWTLRKWAEGKGPLAEKSTAALRTIEEARQNEEAG